MKLSKKFLLTGLLICATFVPMSCPAVDVDTESGPLEKLGRGVANVAFGPLEILIRPYDVNKDKGAIAALTYGVFKGIAYVIARECVGVLDILTFPMPLPGCTDDPLDVGWGYGPMLRPAWVVDTDHNAYNFFYDDDSVIRAQ